MRKTPSRKIFFASQLLLLTILFNTTDSFDTELAEIDQLEL